MIWRSFLLTQLYNECRWSFLHSAEAIRKQEFSDTLPRASIQDLGVILMGAGYEVILLHSFLLCFLSSVLYSLKIKIVSVAKLYMYRPIQCRNDI